VRLSPIVNHWRRAFSPFSWRLSRLRAEDVGHAVIIARRRAILLAMSDQPSIAGPLARIDRADELIADLRDALKAFLGTRPYTVNERPDENPAVRTFVVTSLRDVPARPRIIAGEIAHHLRASLDLLAYQLLLKAGVTDEERLRASAFPVVTNRDLSKPADKRKHDESINAKVLGVSQRAYDRIVALQPCATNKEWSHLAQIQALDNTDKHRLLLAAASSTRIGGWNFRDEHGNVTTLPHDSFKVASPPPEFVLPNPATEITFMEPGPVWGKPLDHILRTLSRMTRQTIEGFADCF
jgi:hypothetical protein